MKILRLTILAIIDILLKLNKHFHLLLVNHVEVTFTPHLYQSIEVFFQQFIVNQKITYHLKKYIICIKNFIKMKTLFKSYL